MNRKPFTGYFFDMETFYRWNKPETYKAIRALQIGSSLNVWILVQREHEEVRRIPNGYLITRYNCGNAEYSYYMPLNAFENI